mmetsp:Transcript_6406/g.24072  ORF Transcript_6406/g.24072 Transcript_6406/m.24072 type:complete len:92 (+) Transcript_6406:779-1054(+)
MPIKLYLRSNLIEAEKGVKGREALLHSSDVCATKEEFKQIMEMKRETIRNCRVCFILLQQADLRGRAKRKGDFPIDRILESRNTGQFSTTK